MKPIVYDNPWANVKIPQKFWIAVVWEFPNHSPGEPCGKVLFESTVCDCTNAATKLAVKAGFTEDQITMYEYKKHEDISKENE